MSVRVTFKRGDECPATVTRVTDEDGDTWNLIAHDTWSCDKAWRTREWDQLLNEYTISAEVPDPAEVVHKLPPEPRGDVQLASMLGRHRFARDSVSGRWKRIDDGAGELIGGRPVLTWHELLRAYPTGLREVAETPYEAAVRRLRENRDPRAASGVTVYAGRGADIDTVIRELVTEGRSNA
ncbi:MAG: hypothetical protein EKK42_20160 [Pseudonocardiaceae bacterium]|nr:MAG: hypothetical protein EKK42_20160 [Pseudonocardiaceae bacterium]